MFGKTLKELNTKSRVKKIKKNFFSYEIIASENEFSYFRLNLKSNYIYLINEKSFYFFLNKGSLLINNKHILNKDKNLIFSKKKMSLKTLSNSEVYLFFFSKKTVLKLNHNNRNIFSKINKSKIRFKTKYWGTIYDLLQNKLGAIKIIEMNKDTQSSMEFHINKKENYFIEYGEMNLGIRYSRGLNGLIKLKKNNSFLMKPGTMHMRMAKKNCRIIEMSNKDMDSDSIIVHDGKNYKFKVS